MQAEIAGVFEDLRPFYFGDRWASNPGSLGIVISFSSRNRKMDAGQGL
jgi:hypothetical protein